MIFIVLSFTVFSSCGSDEITKVPAKLLIDNSDESGLYVIDLSSKAQSQNVTFTAEGEWYVSIPEYVSWISVTPSSGTASSDNPVSVSVNVDKNENSDDRDAYIDFVCDSLTQKSRIQIQQSRMYVLDVTSSKSVVNKNGGDITFNVNTNGNWTYEINEEGKSWLTEKDKEAGSLVLTATSLTDVTVEKSAEITFKSTSDESLAQTVTIYQKDINLQVDASGLKVYSGGGETSLAVSVTNISSWAATSDESWITVEKTSTSGIKVTVAANAGSERTGTVTVTTPDDADVVTSFSVDQDASSDEAPQADVFDAVFASDGTATDAAESRTVTYSSGDECSVSYNSVYGRYAPSFTHTLGGAVTEGYYRTDIDDSMKSFMDDGYTLEAVVMLGKAPTGSEVKAFSSTKSGGTALMVGSSSYGKELLFLLNMNTGGTSHYKFVRTGITPEPGVFYHIIGTWDKTTGVACVYLDGEKKAELTGLTDDLRYGTLSPSNYFAIGGNQSSQTSLNGGWYGDIPIARVYGGPLTADQAKALYLYNFAGHIKVIRN
jgi:hypothetical protein